MNILKTITLSTCLSVCALTVAPVCEAASVDLTGRDWVISWSGSESPDGSILRFESQELNEIGTLFDITGTWQFPDLEIWNFTGTFLINNGRLNFKHNENTRQSWNVNDTFYGGVTDTAITGGTYSGMSGGVQGHWNANSTPTPIPGAVYLLGSGLMGLVAMRRKKQIHP